MSATRRTFKPSLSLVIAVVSVAALCPSPASANPPEAHQNVLSESALLDIADRLNELYYLAAVLPYKSYNAKRFSWAESAGKFDEVFRYIGARGRSRILKLVKTAAAVDGRSSLSDDADADQRREKFKQRLVDEIQKLGAELRRAAAPAGSVHRDAESADDSSRRQRRGVGDARSGPFSSEECNKDYSAFVEPVTNSLWNGIRGAVCEALGLSERLCNALIDPLPDKTMPSWGRRSK
jgi:hypothetical protein